MGAVLDRAATTLVDLLGLINGTVDPAEYIQGENVADWVAANRPGGPAERGVAMSKAEITARKSAYEPEVVQQYLAGLQGSGAKHAVREHPAVRHEARSRALVDNHRLGPGNTALTSRLRRLRGTETEAAMVSPELVQLAGYDPTVATAVNEHRKQVLVWARQQYHKGVIAHELGHSMGLRHNFAATFDSLNYYPQYWQLRTHNGTVTAPCADGTTDGADCVGPRWRDPISAEEVVNSIGRFGTTSVMDYPGDQNHDQLLQGKYDRAALRFGYGGVVDVWSGRGSRSMARGRDRRPLTS